MSACVLYVDELKWKKGLDTAFADYDSLPWHDAGALFGIEAMIDAAPEWFDKGKYRSEVLFTQGLIAGMSLDDLCGDYILGLADS